MEEYLEKNRESYYELLAINKKDITAFVEFFLEAVAEQAEKTITGLKDIDQERVEDSLLPRRREILEIIKDHEIVGEFAIQLLSGKPPARGSSLEASW